jgi:hypothetical protein
LFLREIARLLVGEMIAVLSLQSLPLRDHALHRVESRLGAKFVDIGRGLRRPWWL